MHGVDTDRYAPPADRAAAFAQSGLPGRYAIGCFGRVRAQKGSDVFVEAMCRLLPRYPDFTAVMVGAITPEQQGFANDLKKRIEAAGLQSRIVITGELADRGGAALVPAADDLRLHLAQRRFWVDADRGDVGRVRRWWRRARARPNSWSRTASPAC
jgi:glycosyltransferase involved in cell wall biosynthesis